MIAGWDGRLVGMKAGGLRRLIIRRRRPYGGSRNGPIPPFATLVFDIRAGLGPITRQRVMRSLTPTR